MESILITGASGYLGRLVVEALASHRERFGGIVALDLREEPVEKRRPGVLYETGDIGSPRLAELMRQHRVDVVLHLAAIVTPPKGQKGHELAYKVDVLGTKNVLEACLGAGVKKLITTSSGAAYGYHADNPAWLTEEHPLRGNDAFAYSRHKRLVEEMLEQARREHPELVQLIFRPGTVLGKNVANQITALFEGRFILGLWGVDTPFVFVWDQDVVGALVAGIHNGKTGAYNLAGDGVMTLPEIARLLDKPFVSVPASLLRAALALLHKLGLTPYGPEQVMFLQYRPVLSNERLKTRFGYQLQKTSREAFEEYRKHHARDVPQR